MEHLNKRGLLVEDTTIVQKPEARKKKDGLAHSGDSVVGHPIYPKLILTPEIDNLPGFYPQRTLK